MDKHLKFLHWLKIRERIDFKILLLVFKSISGFAPEYLKELITYNNVSGCRLPFLHTPTYKLSKAEFGLMNYAPQLWNSLPKDVKQCQYLKKIN